VEICASRKEILVEITPQFKTTKLPPRKKLNPKK
jgi:hypothetical protein